MNPVDEQPDPGRATGGHPAGPATEATAGPPPGRDPGRRALTYTVLLGLIGAGLALYATTRTWAVEVTPRPAPLPEVRDPRTGSDLVPGLSALAAVGLAGAGAVLASRGLGRRLVGGLLVLIGSGLAIGGGYGLGLDRGGSAAAWPALTLIGGLLVAVAAAVTVLRGPGWPTLGARYERPGAVPGRVTGGQASTSPTGGPARPTGRADGAGSTVSGAAAGPDAMSGGAGRPDRDSRSRRVGNGQVTAAWDALDRGEDPTDD